ncbi:MAG: WYL domain-containing protein [Planctomycetota bacterium]|nr:WYL domain-containing protein [Planctomycetota bacterium]
MDLSRLHRVLRIITLLQAGRAFNASELAAECRVSRRTIYRDLATIEKVGITFFYNRAGGGYQMHKAGMLPAINLTLEEAMALVLMATELGRTGRMPLFQPARDAAAKIECMLPLGLRAAMGAALRGMAVLPGPMARHNSLHETYRLAQQATTRHEALDAVYISFHDKGQIHTRLEPYWLIFYERAWYLIGRSSCHKAVRTFKLGRFKSLASAKTQFKMPKGLTLEKHLGNAWGMMRGEKSFDVELKFSPLIGPNVAEVNWHKTQKIRWDEDGHVFFTATVDGLDEIVWWVLGYGPEVEVLSPPELRQRVAAMARRTLAMYEKA